MGIKILKITENFPVEIGKSYDTKNSQGLFLVSKITTDKRGKQGIIWGTYLKSNLENCPLDVGRLIVDKKTIEEKEICDCCLLPLNETYVKKHIEF